jgi:hypothetical protein
VFASGTPVSVINSHLFILIMDNRNLDDERPPKEVTAVISRKIKTGYEKDYDDWGRRYMMLERKVPGYLGSTIIVHVISPVLTSIFEPCQEHSTSYLSSVPSFSGIYVSNRARVASASVLQEKSIIPADNRSRKYRYEMTSKKENPNKKCHPLYAGT